MRTSVKSLFIAILCLALTVAGGPAVARAQAEPSCGITWGSADRAAGPLSAAPLVDVRAGRHECWDRVVFEFDGTARGYSVGYSPVVETDGEGLDLVPYTAGGAHLRVSLRAPAHDANHVATIDARTGDRVVNVLRYDTLRDVVFGGSFEGYTTFAVGVPARLPRAGPGSADVPEDAAGPLDRAVHPAGRGRPGPVLLGGETGTAERGPTGPACSAAPSRPGRCAPGPVASGAPARIVSGMFHRASTVCRPVRPRMFTVCDLVAPGRAPPSLNEASTLPTVSAGSLSMSPGVPRLLR
jgi:hypothetical protein